MPTTDSIIILADNGSTKASATLQLRIIAKQLSDRTNLNIHPVSLQHADVISADKLDGFKASILKSFLREKLKLGRLEFIILPLFFGKSRALTKFIPDVKNELEGEFGSFNVTIKDTLYKSSHIFGELNEVTTLASIITDHFLKTSEATSIPLENIVLVDHGSPSPKITAVRNRVATEVQMMLGKTVEQAVMERREGKQYDFNGELLEDWLISKAKQGMTSAIVTLLFALPGRHAGESGDIVTICDSVMEHFPEFKIGISPLVGEHPLLLEILTNRLNA